MAGQIFWDILVLTVAVLLVHVCEAEANYFAETTKALEFSYVYSDEPVHHIKRRSTEAHTDYIVEIEINASSIFVIDEIKKELNRIQNDPPVANLTILETNFTTVCSFFNSIYQCRCEAEYFWPCAMCENNGSCNTADAADACSCIKAKPSGQFCQKKSNPACTQPTTVPPPPVYGKVISMQLRMRNKRFDTSLTNPKDQAYKDQAEIIMSAINKGYGSFFGYIKNSVKVIGFRPGSVMVDYTINATDNSFDFKAANSIVTNILMNSTDNFAQSEPKLLNTTRDAVYPLQSMTLKCPESTVINAIQWSVNEKEPDLDKYCRYACTLVTDSIPIIQWQNIVIEKQPQIDVKGDDLRVFPCDGRTIQLNCCVNTNHFIEWVLLGKVETSGLGCVTFDYKTDNVLCGEKIFTCRLQGLEQLYKYSYSMRDVTIETKAKDPEYTCEKNVLGIGKENETKEGPCDNGMEGNITYKCQKGTWNEIQDNCVVKVIDDLETESQVLDEKEIPKFVESLSNATEKSNSIITKSVATVQTVVDILTTIAEVSENIFIHKPVIEGFLTTVDNILSDESANTWEQLNNGNQAEKNTSVELLQAIEDISSHLSAGNFDITKPNIQLNRNVTDGILTTFSVTSQLQDSTSQIVIPNVPNSTSITIIIFTDIGNVLPTRNTSVINTGTSVNRINGDVIVVQVEPPLNNILLTFDIKNTSLGNPECVFWNFTLDRWDSTGCKVKFYLKENVTCECDHTTSFSILMSPFEFTNPEELKALAYITYIGVAISITSLILCLIIEKIVWKSVKRNDTSYMRHVSIVNIAVSLLIANICFIIGAAIADQDIKQGLMISVARCSPVVFFMHFFYLAVFFWMLISALLLLYRTVVVLAQMSRTIMRVIGFTVGYGAPLLIAVITVASTAGPKNYVSKENACWLNWTESKALLAFVIPALTIVFINLVVLIVVVCKILRRGVGAASQPAERPIFIVIARCLAFLTPIFGLTWGFGIGTMVSRDFGIHVVFALLNSLQGFFVLVFGILLDGKVREVLGGKLSLSSLSSSPTRSTNPGVSSSSGLGLFARLRRNVYNVSNPSSSRPTNSSGASENLMNP
ncbi:adhesion G protein-coupled receptor F5-like [Triplophysa dalaica]|uniref:adhesion G protein-coupled receptor F5-like n=1 Tax=Triplophysa dalaica TaxID=1582913 RepID=UPI0024DF873B|nr:adhesion G protein-coupled receptor F5-like [Triplophysa dalaica]